MPIPPVRYGLAILMAISLSGCYSGGRWTMPNLAFWKSNPFSSTASSTAPESIPRPTELANQPGPEPGAGYAANGTNTADTLAPRYPSTPSDFASQQPYPATQPGAGGALTPYMPPQQGYYDPNPPGALTASHPSSSNPYTVPDAPPSQPAPSYSRNPYAARDGSASPAPFGSDPAGPARPYESPSGGYVSANPSGPYGNPVRDDSREAYDARLADYRSSAGMHGSAIPDYRGDARSQPPGSPSPAYDPRNPPAGAYDPRHRPAIPEARSGYGEEAPPTGYGSNTPNGYYPPAGGYSPGDTGYNPPGAPPYHPPAGIQSPDLPPQNSDSSYSPGSVSRYGR